jgi:hypothetical protein
VLYGDLGERIWLAGRAYQTGQQLLIADLESAGNAAPRRPFAVLAGQ